MSETSSQNFSSKPLYLEKADGAKIAYYKLSGKGPGIVFFGGFASDMSGTKALAIETFARSRGQAFLRFDYQGHGQSSGEFIDGTISKWLSDSIAIIIAQTEGPQIFVGSSMGGWISLLTAIQCPDRIAALVGIASAPDFTEDLMWNRFDESIRNKLQKDGIYLEPTEYGDHPYEVTLQLIEDGRKHLLLRDKLTISTPIRLLHGMADADVPYQLSIRLAEHIDTRDVEVTLIKGGDHRLSRKKDLTTLMMTIEKLTNEYALK
jgi:pimeloyl-ACP methyl ester carboxylesterase